AGATSVQPERRSATASSGHLPAAASAEQSAPAEPQCCSRVNSTAHTRAGRSELEDRDVAIALARAEQGSRAFRPDPPRIANARLTSPAVRDCAMEIRTTDYHTAGEPFRIVRGGVPDIPGATVRDRREYASGSDEVDRVRRMLCHEPRGHADM